jgi:hypothetical protein
LLLQASETKEEFSALYDKGDILILQVKTKNSSTCYSFVQKLRVPEDYIQSDANASLEDSMTRMTITIVVGLFLHVFI